MVHDQLILTLRKSNIPAYAAPTLEAKKVGSLSKYTQLNVIGTWDDFYIVSLRDASAFIPMDAAVWTSAELDEWLCFTKTVGQRVKRLFAPVRARIGQKP